MSTVRKERPKCRIEIMRLQLAPILVNGTWDGRATTIGPDGGGISAGLLVQMAKMVEEGYWGPIRIVRATSERQASSR